MSDRRAYTLTEVIDSCPDWGPVAREGWDAVATTGDARLVKPEWSAMVFVVCSSVEQRRLFLSWLSTLASELLDRIQHDAVTDDDTLVHHVLNTTEVLSLGALHRTTGVETLDEAVAYLINPTQHQTQNEGN